jgi:hypothetical protein
MAEEINDMMPADPGKKLPAPLDAHLRSIIPGKGLDQFREQLPAEFLSDASEGLDQMNDRKQLEKVLHQLNQQMRQHLTPKKTHKKRRSVGYPGWVYWVIVIVILLIVIAFLVVQMLLKK